MAIKVWLTKKDEGHLSDQDTKRALDLVKPDFDPPDELSVTDFTYVSFVTGVFQISDC